MSSRALRKAQRARERQQLERDLSGDDESETESTTQSVAKPSMFAMLNIEEGEDDNDDEDDGSDKDNLQSATATSQNPLTQTTKPEKKRKGKKKKTKASASASARNFDTGQIYDEIDAVLKSLSVTNAAPATSTLDSDTEEVCKLLSVESQHLQVANEMKRWFGRAAFREDGDNRAENASFHDGTNGEHLSLAEAVTGIQSVPGPGLASALRRRNLFVQAKEDWPRAVVTGLGMEVTKRMPGDVVEFAFTHNDMYRRVQTEFQACVSSMDPVLMVTLLRHNPYHVATLLQVCEIAKQDGEHATAGELLERALFSFGRAAHSTFGTYLSKGKARMDFHRPENREFWLAAWKYIGNIGMRATWRTAFEWAKLLLALDPQNDPYCVRLVIDQLALRSNQPQTLLSLSRCKLFGGWKHQPNIAFSLSLAEKMAGQDASEGSRAKVVLMDAVRRFPWVAALLFRELEIDKTPACIWGKSPQTARDKFESELYVALAQDLWKLPDSLSFLSTTVPHVTSASLPLRYNSDAITINEGRLAILTEKPKLISLVPREITAKLTSAADPLPPEDSLQSFRRPVHAVGDNPMDSIDALVENDPGAFMNEIYNLQTFFQQLLPNYFHLASAETGDRDNRRPIADAVVQSAIVASNLPVDEIQARLTRLVELRDALMGRLGRRVTNAEGDEMTMDDDGMARITYHGGAGGEEGNLE